MKNIEAILKAKPRKPGVSNEAARKLVAKAADAGLIDVAYAFVDSPYGGLLAAVTSRGLVRLSFQREESTDDILEELSRRVSPRVLEAPGELDEVRRELDEYFAGRRRQFEIPLDWRLSRGFKEKVLRATARIPYGGMSTYREMAAKAGNSMAYRAAGNALGSNPIPIVVPCHRVLATGGGLGGYGGGLDMKESLLRMEGVLLG